MQTEQLLCWSGTTGTELQHGSNKEDRLAPTFTFIHHRRSLKISSYVIEFGYSFQPVHMAASGTVGWLRQILSSCSTAGRFVQKAQYSQKATFVIDEDVL